MDYGYARVSTPSQNIDRQIRNILAACPGAQIYKEVYTRTTFYGRKEWNRLMKLLKKGDRVYFDSVSRMSGDEVEGFELYQELYQKGVDLIFLKEPHIDTEVYRKALQNQIELTGTDVDYILEGINRYMMALAREQIRLAFQQAEKEVTDLRQRTKEGLETAKLNGKHIGIEKGRKLTTKKSIEAKKIILKHNKTFGGTLTNEETWKLAGITKTSFYKYKEELLKEENNIK